MNQAASGQMDLLRTDLSCGAKVAEDDLGDDSSSQEDVFRLDVAVNEAERVQGADPFHQPPSNQEQQRVLQLSRDALSLHL